MQFDLQTPKKQQVDLSDYAFEADLLSRHLLAGLSPAYTLHLIELFYLSSKTTLQKLKSALDLSDEELKNFMKTIAPLEILRIENDVVSVDKEAKKKIECFLEKFSEDFSPGIEYFQSLLKQVPIQILPNWYSLPRSCESIFQSLKERIFLTPNLYLRHLQEIDKEGFPCQIVIQALLNAPNHTLSISEIADLTQLPLDVLDQLFLFLEFNFAAVLCYTQEQESWTPHLKLPVELSQYLKTKSVSPPFSSLPQNLVNPDRGIPLTFAFDLSQVLRFVKMTPVKMMGEQNVYSFDPLHLEKIENTLLCSREYVERLLTRGLELKLLEVDHGFLSLCLQAEQWLLYSLEKQALTLYKALWIQKNQGGRQAEKGLASLLSKGWVLLEEVLEFVSHGKPSLQRGRDGFFYDICDQVKMTKESLDILFESGIIERGKFEGKRCVRLTDLGSQICG